MSDWHDYIPIINILLNLILLPVVKLLIDLKVELTKTTTRICAFENRLQRIEARCDLAIGNFVHKQQKD